jgi:hypothetical protein
MKGWSPSLSNGAKGGENHRPSIVVNVSRTVVSDRDPHTSDFITSLELFGPTLVEGRKFLPITKDINNGSGIRR